MVRTFKITMQDFLENCEAKLTDLNSWHAEISKALLDVHIKVIKIEEIHEIPNNS